MKKIYLIIPIFIILFLGLIIVRKGLLIDSNLKYSKEYLTNDKSIKGNVNISYFSNIDEDFSIGANKYGYAVFKNPNKAFSKLKKLYKKGLNLIKNEFGLMPLSIFNYEKYKIYGWQVRGGSSLENEQAMFISQFMDIYENSYKSIN